MTIDISEKPLVLDTDGWSPQGPVVELSEEHSWILLAQGDFGRLALSVDGRPAIFPVDYVTDGRTVLFRTAQGTKLHDILRNDRVAFEADRRVRDESWSVIIDGIATIITDPAGIADAERAPLPHWTPTAPPVYLRITPTAIHGRRYVHSVLADRG